MAKREHLKIARSGVKEWNAWRKKHTNIRPNLRNADLRVTDLAGYDFAGVNLSNADLSWVNLQDANLADVDLTDAFLYEAHLEDLDFREAVLDGAIFENARLARANFAGADMDSVNFKNADLEDVSLIGAILTEADFTRASLIRTNFSGADLEGARFDQATMIATDFSNSQLSGSSVYGVSAWDVILNGAQQDSLVITPEDQASITVDNLEVAQFVYLMLHNEKIRDVIDTITSTAVLILGRFTPERKIVLDAIREKLRELNYTPIMFDFDRSEDRDFTETIMTLAGMCRFIIADITNPKSSPLELQAAVPNYMIPFVTIIQEGEKPFEMFKDLHGKFDWVLDPLEYDTTSNLVEALEKAVIEPALEKHRELIVRKAEKLPVRSIKDY